ncbi:MAG: VCBS repeat-containing protein [Pseudomonadota bacterium]
MFDRRLAVRLRRWIWRIVLGGPLMGLAAAFAEDLTPLPDGAVARADGRGITQARYIAPTTRYAHAVLGDAIEAGGIWVRDASGQEHVLMLPDDSVFEDITPRLADLDGDGGAEVIAIRAYAASGAALTILDVRNGALAIIAETRPIGRSNRWLNPAGIADYDGDGRPEIAIIKTPHIGGILELYELAGPGLRRDARVSGYSNHEIGARALDLSASVDVNGDGVTDLIVPNQQRTQLAALSFITGQPVELGRVALGFAIDGDISLSGMRLTVPLRDGSRARIEVSEFR